MSERTRLISQRVVDSWVYYYPIPAFSALTLCWWMITKSLVFTTYVMFLPVLYGYIVPGIATNFLHKWHFSGRWMIGKYLAHHGIMYAANLGPALLLPFLIVLRGKDLSTLQGLAISVCAASISAFILWLHDTWIVRLGLVQIYNRPAREGKSADEIVFHYAPFCFFAMGLSYGLSAVHAYRRILISGDTSLGCFLTELLAGFILMLILSTIAYGIVEYLEKD